MLLTTWEFLIIFLTIVLLYIAYWYLSVPSNLPPGPVGLPLIGSSLDYINAAKLSRMLQENVKKYGPVHKCYILNKLVIILGDYETILEALVSDAFTGRPPFHFTLPESCRGRGIALSEGQVWKQERRFALSTLRDFGLGRSILEPRIREEMEYLTKELDVYASNGESFDPTQLLTFAVANIICQLVFGKRYSYDEEVLAQHFTGLHKRLSTAGVSTISPFVLSDWFFTIFKSIIPQVKTMARETQEFFQFLQLEIKEILAAYDKDLEPDNYVQAYMKASPETAVIGSDSYYNLCTSASDLFVAGSETTSSTIRWAILFLGLHPGVQQKMYEEIRSIIGVGSLPTYGDRTELPYTEAVITEIQRRTNLAPLGFPRRCVTPGKLAGYDIPEGAIMVSLLVNVLHNPDYFPDPLTFNPERFIDSNGKLNRDPKVIPFQAGKRVCPGESLARMELFIFLTTFIVRYQFFFSPDEPQPSVEPVAGLSSSPIPYRVFIKARK